MSCLALSFIVLLFLDLHCLVFYCLAFLAATSFLPLISSALPCLSLALSCIVWSSLASDCTNLPFASESRGTGVQRLSESDEVSVLQPQLFSILIEVDEFHQSRELLTSVQVEDFSGILDLNVHHAILMPTRKHLFRLSARKSQREKQSV